LFSNKKKFSTRRHSPMQIVLGAACLSLVLSPVPPVTSHWPLSVATPARAAVRMADVTTVADTVTNACLVASGTCTPQISPFEQHIFEGFNTLGGDIAWSISVAGFGLVGAYLSRGTEAFSVEEHGASFDEYCGRSSQGLLDKDRADALGGDDPFF
jgi:hypothetical protein